MSNSSAEIKSKISDLESKIAALEDKSRKLRSEAEQAEIERREHAFSALIEGNESSKNRMQELDGTPQKFESEARNLEAAMNAAIKRLLDLRADFANAIVREKLQEVRALCAQARNFNEQYDKLAAPLLVVVKKASNAEEKISRALLELGQIVRPSKLRESFEPPLAIENRARDLMPCSAVLAAHALGKGGILNGVEIGERDEQTVSCLLGKLDDIEAQLDKLDSGLQKISLAKKSTSAA